MSKTNGVINDKKGRTLKITVDDLLSSKRLNIAVHNFKRDPKQLEAILIELGMEAHRVAKTAFIKVYNNHVGLSQFELLPILRSWNDYNTYNIYWGLNPFEQKLYMADPKLELNKEEYDKLFKKVKEQYGFD